MNYDDLMKHIEENDVLRDGLLMTRVTKKGIGLLYPENKRAKIARKYRISEYPFPFEIFESKKSNFLILRQINE